MSFNPSALAAQVPSFQPEDYGKLTVYSDVKGADIYVDAKYVGQDSAAVSNIPAGKHYVRVVKEEKTLQSGLVDVKPGDETIIVAKQTEEELMAKFRKPNFMLLMLDYAAVGYNMSPAVQGLSSFNLNPQYGLGFELNYPVPIVDFRVDLGFMLNTAAVLRFYDLTSATWQDGKVSISSPYICVSKELVQSGPIRIGLGGGLNYALYTPGGGVQLSIEPRLGYMGYLEVSRMIQPSQKFVCKLGYASFSGKAGTTDITSAGFYLQGGIGYQL